eukprot:1399512-Pleurochrysis_carterae.AAC.1
MMPGGRLFTKGNGQGSEQKPEAAARARIRYKARVGIKRGLGLGSRLGLGFGPELGHGAGSRIGTEGCGVAGG